ncbi:FixH family protein [Altibacter sp. HG106]|uniref:FixH family protein n=1 Tax=Altibacter sp. HG106 TaxID=3023937 RepID=UPI002350834D|nr:FixH family protein [Altibacter sp. HG106]MDC7994338.1 FixH family protein [Altibacter sp. HG106]
MKINWGFGIVIGMTLFISFIMYLVIRMTTEEAFDHDMVTENYYAKEMVYQREIDAETNTKNLNGKIKSSKVAEGWELVFPAELEPSKISGKLYVYRPSNEDLDTEWPLDLDSPRLVIPKENLLDGRWNITLDWEYEGQHYMYKEAITY